MRSDQTQVHYFVPRAGCGDAGVCTAVIGPGGRAAVVDRHGVSLSVPQQIDPLAWLRGNGFTALRLGDQSLRSQLVAPFSSEVALDRLNCLLFDFEDARAVSDEKQFFHAGHSLAETLLCSGLMIESAAPSDVLASLGYGELKITMGEQSHRFPFNNEFGDAEAGHLLACFNLVLLECEAYRESTDFLDWCALQGWDATSEDLRQLYGHLGDGTVWLDTVLPGLESAASDFDFEMANGFASAVRAIRI